MKQYPIFSLSIKHEDKHYILSPAEFYKDKIHILNTDGESGSFDCEKFSEFFVKALDQFFKENL